MNILKSLEVMTLSETNTVISRDSADENYKRNNSLSYYVLINTWLMLLRVVSPYGYLRIRDNMLRNGLLPLIKRASDTADRVVHGFPITDPLFHELEREVKLHLSAFLNERLDDSNMIGKDNQATLLLLLRYPKRFTPNSNDWIQEESLKEFIQFENRTKMIQRREFSPIIIGWVQAEADKVCDWDKLCREIDSISDKDLIPSSGVAYDTGSHPGQKLRAMYEHNVYGGLSLVDLPKHSLIKNDKGEIQDYRPVKVLAVPKSYKASRIIAMEDTYRQAKAKRVSLIIRSYMPECIDVTDQTRNQRLAYEGSIYGTYATLDLRHGSDPISKRHVIEFLPWNFVSRIMPLTGTHTEIGGVVRVMQTFSTAGNCLTFDIETLIFYIVAKAACRVAARMSGLPDEEPYVSVYGDDVIVPNQYAEAVIDLFTYFGFPVNVEKSFFHGNYRESCGEEYCNGTSNTSLYFPRFPLVGRIVSESGSYKISTSTKIFSDEFRGKKWDCTTMLIDLQHKLFPICYQASRFLYEMVVSVYPKMTSSHPGSLCEDLWEFDDSGMERKFPVGEFLGEGKDRKLNYLPSLVPGFDSYQTRDYSGKEVVLVESTLQGIDWVHMSPSISYSLHSGKAPSDDEVNKLRYLEFLRTGPRYRDELSRLLGVTDPLPTKEQLFGDPAFTWKLNG